MGKRKIKVCWLCTTLILSYVFACWAGNDTPDYLQDRRYTYEGDSYRICSYREIDETMLDEMSQSITIKDEEQIEIGQTFLPELQLPEDVPEEYRFESLTVTQYLSGRWEYIFVYKDTFEKEILTFYKDSGTDEIPLHIEQSVHFPAEQELCRGFSHFVLHFRVASEVKTCKTQPKICKLKRKIYNIKNPPNR